MTGGVRGSGTITDVGRALLEHWRAWPLVLKLAAGLLVLCIFAAAVLDAREGKDYEACDRLAALDAGPEYADVWLRCFGVNPSEAPAWVREMQ